MTLKTKDRESQKAAKKKGLKRYSIERPCPRGHTVDRYVSTGRCSTCVKDDLAKWRSQNAKHMAEYKRTYNEANAEQIAERRRIYNEANAERISEYKREYRIRTGT